MRRALPAWIALVLVTSACDAAGPGAAGAGNEATPARLEQAASNDAQPAAFPELTGRVVDRADLLSTDVEARLTALSEELERRTSDQFVIVTLPSLEGRAIDEYSRALGNHWGIGQAETDNGVLLVVAPSEQQVRIEGGSGLEAIVTNARAREIIERDLLSAFREGKLEEGVLAGASSIARTLTDRADTPRRGRP